MTTIYLIRHSEPFGKHRGMEDIHESILFSNIKTPLSVDGEHLAEEVSNNKEFENIDVVWSSNYVRAISTAKYFANKNGLKVNISEKLGERIHGIKTWKDLPEDYEKHQFEDENYKILDGESQKEVRERMLNAISIILNDNKNKRIIIVGHSTAFSFLLKEWCDINYLGNYYFNNNIFFNGKWNYCESFKLEFDDSNNLISIKGVKYD